MVRAKTYNFSIDADSASNRGDKKMKVHLQLCLYIAAAIALSWAVALFMAPQAVHAWFSLGQYDSATTAMWGASLFAFALLFLMAGLNPINPLVHVSVIAILLLSVAAVFEMFIRLPPGMVKNGVTFLSVLIFAVVGLILFFSVIQPPVAALAGRARRGAQGSHRRPRAAARAIGRRRPAARKATGSRRGAAARRKRR